MPLEQWCWYSLGADVSVLINSSAQNRMNRLLLDKIPDAIKSSIDLTESRTVNWIFAGSNGCSIVLVNVGRFKLWFVKNSQYDSIACEG